MNRQEIIAQKLSVLAPQYLKIVNESHLHNHHDSSPNNGQSHFAIQVFADSIASKRLVEQHKIINNLLKEEFSRGLHALSITILKK